MSDFPSEPVGAGHGVSTVYTTEPMATRALGAELRHHSPAFVALVEDRLGLSSGALGSVVDVACESKARIDVLLTMTGTPGLPGSRGDLDGGELTGAGRHGVLVGIEAKFDHALTHEQLEAEQQVAPYLVILVVDPADAADHLGPGRAVITWAEALACFPGSRLTPADIAAIPATKMRTERLMRAEAAKMTRLGEGWTVEVLRGGSGMPSITVRSPALPDGRELRGQIQVRGRRMPGRMEDLTFEYHVGIGVEYDETDFPDPETATEPPGWIGHLKVLESVIGGLDGQATLWIGGRRAMNGGGDLGARKLPLVEKFLDDKAWLAKGYADWALGIRSVPASVEQLGDLCLVAEWIFLSWYEASVKRRVERRVAPR